MNNTRLTRLNLTAPLSGIPMFHIKYLTMQKVHMHVGAIRQFLYGCAYVREIVHSLKLVDYLPVRTHKPYNNYTCTYHSVYEDSCVTLATYYEKYYCV